MVGLEDAGGVETFGASGEGGAKTFGPATVG